MQSITWSGQVVVVTTGRSLRSSEQELLVVPRSRLKTKGDHAFAFAVAPQLTEQPHTEY